VLLLLLLPLLLPLPLRLSSPLLVMFMLPLRASLMSLPSRHSRIAPLPVYLCGMKQPDVDPSLCPLCAGPNNCGLVDGGKTCWCYSATISRTAIERVPSDRRGLACICRQCGVEFKKA
jgi:hypothetical protein